MLVMVHRLDGGDRRAEDAPLQITVLNFSGETIEGTVRSEFLVPQSTAVDAATGDVVGRVDELQSFSLELGPYAGLFWCWRRPRPTTESRRGAVARRAALPAPFGGRDDVGGSA